MNNLESDHFFREVLPSASVELADYIGDRMAFSAMRMIHIARVSGAMDWGMPNGSTEICVSHRLRLA